MRRDASVCRALAQEDYHSDLGARSLKTAVKKIEHMLVNAYLNVDEEFEEGSEMMDYVVDISLGEVVLNLVRDNGAVFRLAMFWRSLELWIRCVIE